MRRWVGAADAAPARSYELNDLSISFPDRTVRLSGDLVELTDLEYRLLYDLATNPGRVLTHAELLRRVWGPGHAGKTGVVRTVIKQLRRKLGDDAADPKYIFNQPRVGYSVPKPDSQSS